MSNEIAGALSSFNALLQIGKTAIEARDWAKISEVRSELSEEVIKTQQAVISGQAAQTDLIRQLCEAHEKVRELQKTIAEKERHTIEEVFSGHFALLVGDAPGAQDLLLEGQGHAKKYACQRCFSHLGKSILLQPRFERGINIGLHCSSCGTTLLNNSGISYAATPITAPNGAKVFPKI